LEDGFKAAGCDKTQGIHSLWPQLSFSSSEIVTSLLVAEEAGVGKRVGYEQRQQNDRQRQQYRKDLGQKLVED
jgi:hypothetical protein